MMLLALAAGAVVLVAVAVDRQDAPARVANTATTRLSPPSTSVPTTSTTAVPEATAEAVGGDAHVGEGDADGPRPGVIVTNTGSATASVGGNVVSGGPGAGDPPAAIVTGDATAVGNSSSVLTP